MHPGEPDVPGESQTNVFLAYASEDKRLAYAIRDVVNKYAKEKNYGDIRVNPWKWNSQAGKTILQDINDNMMQSEFGVFIFSPTIVAMRGDLERLVPVDNVVFEAGMFTSMKGAGQTIILLPKDYDVAPTDLGGIIGIQYDYKGFDPDGTFEENEPVIWDTCVKVTKHIHAAIPSKEPLAAQSRSASQPLLDTGQVSGGARPAQLNSPLEQINETLRVGARQKSLPGLRHHDVERWMLVVHPKYGVGEVVAFDPPGQEHRYITVQFGSSSGVFDIAELHVAPISAQEGAD